jgi:hypothetical protein
VEEAEPDRIANGLKESAEIRQFQSLNPNIRIMDGRGSGKGNFGESEFRSKNHFF